MLEIYDLIVKDLFEQKSIASLIYLINNGRELEFELCHKKCFISCSGSREYVSLWIESEEQSFSSLEDLVENARVEDKRFIELWDDIEIDTLF